MSRDLLSLGRALLYVLAYLLLIPFWTISANLLSENSDVAFALGVISAIVTTIYGFAITRSLVLRVFATLN